MSQSQEPLALRDYFWYPVARAIEHCRERRHCRKLSDLQWLQMGVGRCLGEHRSGRAFLQQWAMEAVDGKYVIDRSHFFGTQSSQRRCRWVEEVNRHVASNLSEHSQEIWSKLPQLDNFELYAGDGHFHAASVHEVAVEGKRRSPCHFYALNLRTRAMTHLTVGLVGSNGRKREHDMHALKRLSHGALRQGAPKGKKVLYAWDSAAIDFQQWYKWKQSSGIYFLCRNKENIRFMMKANLAIADLDAPINAGVLSDQMVGVDRGPSFRLIRYECPQTLTIHEFITNEMTLQPGVLAWIYKRRWHIEKTYDTFKNKLQETKAWGRSETAKSMQAQFLCLTHNLTVILEDYIAVHENIQNSKETQRNAKRIKQAVKKVQENNRSISPLYTVAYIHSQVSLKFIRWLRIHFNRNTSYNSALEALRYTYLAF